ncbi:endonuclease/exonuclease/phosphatase family protein [Methylobacterium nodulans]|uniref:Endonuclease/exonuclease/phosphatase n=1 Tax=Methylobacterium nodulans (strain LMG 21967 / CNCM I-2342 / ORS 2060) TaxID=460265 RepID=B8ICE8_METNO|nr:endonuclease/exonuclease/phosphatase family protein [Methylobacterium nodulans]ACL55536.1 Endonuclease/exonuclease/phosphatase [Methylobacterium nodulans ORS 2060]
MLNHPHLLPAGGAPIQVPVHRAPRKIISWNLLRRSGATVEAVAALIEHEKPDLLLMQEATVEITDLQERVGGHYAWAPLPRRIHGLAMWSPTPWLSTPRVIPIPSGALVDRVCQVLDCGTYGVANVHLSHGQMLNRRQLRRIEQHLPVRAAVLGDYNLVGPALLPGFRDVGPRHPTHAMVEIVPLRLDRCLVRGLICRHTAVLPRGASDHRPIVVHLEPSSLPLSRPGIAHLRDRVDLRGMAAAIARRRRAGAPASPLP